MAEKNAAAVPTVLKCLSILQPWAHFIVNGPKDVENRSWNTKLRGLILIHTGKKFSRDEFHDACGQALNCGVKRQDLPSFEDLPTGGIVGAAELLDCIPPNSKKAGGAWYQGDFGFVLGRRIALPFRALKGSRQFFPVETTDAETKTLRAAGLLH